MSGVARISRTSAHDSQIKSGNDTMSAEISQRIAVRTHSACMLPYCVIAGSGTSTLM